MQGIVDRQSRFGVDQTVDRLKQVLQSRGITLFDLIDHSGEAGKIGLEMPPTKLLIFGNPRAGTPLMRASPHSALDLPLKLLVWQDAGGKVSVSYNDATYLQQRHALPDAALPVLSAVEAIVGAAGLEPPNGR